MVQIVVISGHSPFRNRAFETTDTFKKILNETKLHLKNIDIEMKQRPICKKKNLDLRAIYLAPKNFTKRKRDVMKRLLKNKKNIKKFLNKTKKKKKPKKN